jgi:hypothetical protein
MNTFHNVWSSEIHINLKIDADALTDAGVAFVSAVQYIMSIKDSEGSILVSAYASTVYAVRRMKWKTKQILHTLLRT